MGDTAGWGFLADRILAAASESQEEALPDSGNGALQSHGSEEDDGGADDCGWEFLVNDVVDVPAPLGAHAEIPSAQAPGRRSALTLT